MTCEQIKDLVPLHFDGELDVLRSREVEQHLADCADCRRVLDTLTDLRHSVRSSYPYETVPTALRTRIAGATLGKQERISVKWVYPFAAGLALGGVLVFGWLRQPAPHNLAEQLIGDHIRSLMATSLVDVPSSDRHTVKPWFQGKLNFSPDVVDLAAQGFPLVGGRAEFVEGQPAAALVYRRQKHVINLFVTSGNAPLADLDRQGFHERSFSLHGLSYWAVSDLNGEELEQFTQQFIAAAR